MKWKPLFSGNGEWSHWWEIAPTLSKRSADFLRTWSREAGPPCPGAATPQRDLHEWRWSVAVLSLATNLPASPAGSCIGPDVAPPRSPGRSRDTSESFSSGFRSTLPELPTAGAPLPLTSSWSDLIAQGAWVLRRGFFGRRTFPAAHASCRRPGLCRFGERGEQPR
jgi:hypothetical protein